MAGLLDVLFGNDTDTVDQLRRHVGDDRERAEQAYTAAAGTILRGLEKKSETEEGAQSVWDMLRKQVEQGNVPADSPSQQSGVEVRDMDPKVANDMMKVLFGKDAPEVQGGYAKVVKLDPATSQKIFEKVMPAVLGTIFGATERAPEENPQALPKVVQGARREMEERQPKSSGVLAAILDRDHDGDVDMDDLAGIFAPKPR